MRTRLLCEISEFKILQICLFHMHRSGFSVLPPVHCRMRYAWSIQYYILCCSFRRLETNLHSVREQPYLTNVPFFSLFPKRKLLLFPFFFRLELPLPDHSLHSLRLLFAANHICPAIPFSSHETLFVFHSLTNSIISPFSFSEETPHYFNILSLSIFARFIQPRHNEPQLH